MVGALQHARLILVPWLCIYCVPLSLALIAYDCNDASVNTTVISLREVKSCKREGLSYMEETVRVQIIQRNEVKHHKVLSCLVEVSRLIFHCGMHSHSSIVNNGLSTYVTAVGAEECKNIHRYRTFSLMNNHIANININATTSASFVLHGALGSDGACQGVSYNENGYHWDHVTVLASIKIITMEYFATVKLDSNEISLKDGLSCPFLKGYCMDSTYGETTWDLDIATSKDITILHDGKAHQVIDLRTREKYIIVEEENKIFALTLVKTIYIYDREVWQTEHPRLIVLELKKEAPLVANMNTHPGNTNLLTYINSKFLYIEQSYKKALDSMYIDAIFRRCELHREILKNRLMLAQSSPSNLGWILKNEAGYVGRVLGEVIYLIQCLPRPVTVRRTDKCYNELPITIDDQEKFMSPITHIIQAHAEEVDCNSITPPLFFINQEWIGLNPFPTTRKNPDELEPNYEEKLNFQPIRPLGQGGIYTQEEVEKSQRNLLFGIERKAVENILVRKIIGTSTDNQGYNTLKLFSADELKRLAKNSLQYIWGWFTDFGMIMSGIYGIYMILLIVQYIANVILNGWQIYKTSGCSFAICGSLWNGLASFILHRYHLQRANAHSSKEDNNPEDLKVVTEQPPQSTYPRLPDPHWTTNTSTNNQA